MAFNLNGITLTGDINELKDLVIELNETIDGTGAEYSQTMTDFFFSVESSYQTFYDLDQDNWDKVDTNNLNYGVDDEKLTEYKRTNKVGYNKFVKWFKAHQNKNTKESALLKDIYNTPENMAMVNIYKRLRLKEFNGRKLTLKLQGRGTRKGFDYDSNRSLRLRDSERFALYLYDRY